MTMIAEATEPTAAERASAIEGRLVTLRRQHNQAGEDVHTLTERLGRVVAEGGDPAEADRVRDSLAQAESQARGLDSAISILERELEIARREAAEDGTAELREIADLRRREYARAYAAGAAELRRMATEFAATWAAVEEARVRAVAAKRNVLRAEGRDSAAILLGIQRILEPGDLEMNGQERNALHEMARVLIAYGSRQRPGRAVSRASL